MGWRPLRPCTRQGRQIQQTHKPRQYLSVFFFFFFSSGEPRQCREGAVNTYLLSIHVVILDFPKALQRLSEKPRVDLLIHILDKRQRVVVSGCNRRLPRLASVVVCCLPFAIARRASAGGFLGLIWSGSSSSSGIGSGRDRDSSRLLGSWRSLRLRSLWCRCGSSRGWSRDRRRGGSRASGSDRGYGCPGHGSRRFWWRNIFFVGRGGGGSSLGWRRRHNGAWFRFFWFLRLDSIGTGRNNRHRCLIGRDLRVCLFIRLWLVIHSALGFAVGGSLFQLLVDLVGRGVGICLAFDIGVVGGGGLGLFMSRTSRSSSQNHWCFLCVFRGNFIGEQLLIVLDQISDNIVQHIVAAGLFSQDEGLHESTRRLGLVGNLADDADDDVIERRLRINVENTDLAVLEIELLDALMDGLNAKRSESPLYFFYI